MAHVVSNRVVFWDFDGTLAWREGMWRGALVTALEEVAPGHGVTAAVLRPGLVGGFPWHSPDVEHSHLSNADAWWGELSPALQRAYIHAGVDESIALLAASRVRDVYTEPRHWSVFPDTRDALTSVADAGFRNIVLSNHVPELPRLIDDLGLSDLLSEIITSATTGIEKPNPRAFQLALTSAGNPDQVWMVGDSKTSDVAGALGSGIRALLVRTPDDDGTVRTVAEAAEVIVLDATTGT